MKGLGNTDAYIRNSTALTEVLDAVVISPSDLLDSLDVMSLFTKVPLELSLTLLGPLFLAPVVALFEYVL